MLKEAIDRLLTLAQPAHMQFEERDYTDKLLHPVMSPLYPTVAVATLSGLREFAKWGVEEDERADCAFVVSPERVALIEHLRADDWHRRPERCVATLPAKCSFKFGTWMDTEQFQIEVRAGFVDDEFTRAVLQLVSSLSQGQEVTRADDGISQQVTTKAGVHLVGQAVLPNPVTLAAWRTFPEVPQPFAQYVFRVRASAGSAPQLALFDVAGSGRWQLEATAEIAKWLRENVPGVAVLA